MGPDGYKAKAIEHVAIGWNATRESTHSLRDATAFASPGAKIDILVLDAKPSVKGHGSEPGADIARHLARHGFVSRVVPASGGREAEGAARVTAARHDRHSHQQGNRRTESVAISRRGRLKTKTNNKART